MYIKIATPSLFLMLEKKECFRKLNKISISCQHVLSNFRIAWSYFIENQLVFTFFHFIDYKCNYVSLIK